MSTFLLCCVAITAVPMVICDDPEGAIILSVNPFFWLGCSVFA